MSRKAARPAATVGDICDTLESLAPLALAQEWDNVGLLAGDRAAPVRHVLLCIDLMPAVVEEAAAAKTDFLMAYHPPIFKPVARLTAPSAGPEEGVLRCIRAGIAVHTLHTALDAAEGGTNDVLAELCGVQDPQPLEWVDAPGRLPFKLAVFVPAAAADPVAEALFAAGAGRIGNYTRCSFRAPGEGSFYGGSDTSPAVGRKGRLERVEELRLETVVPAAALPAVVTALRAAHPYEEPAFDIYPLKPPPMRGIGRVGGLRRPQSLRALAAALARATGSKVVQTVGDPARTVERAIVVAGSAGSLPFRIPLTPADVIVTGEIRHHDALSILRRGATAIALGHWESERPALARLGERVATRHPDVRVTISRRDCAPFFAR